MSGSTGAVVVMTASNLPMSARDVSPPGSGPLGGALGPLDRIRAQLVQRQIKVHDVTLGEAPDEDYDGPVMPTSDGFFLLELLGDEDSQRTVTQLIDDLYRADADLARNTIMSARSEPPAELEENS